MTAKLRHWSFSGFVVALLMCLGQVLVRAQTPQSEFVPADTLPREELPATPLVFAAYAFVWVALVAYVFVLWRRLTRVERELADVNAQLRQRRS